MENAIKKYLALQQQIKELQDIQEQLKETIQEAMVDLDTEHLTGSFYDISWITVRQTRLDTQKLKKEHPEIYSEYSRTNTSSRFTVKAIASKEVD